MAWGKAGSKTLDSTDDAISVTSMSANDTFQYMSHIITSSTFGVYDRYNDVSSGSLYHGRYETNGTADQPFQADQIYSMLDNSGGTSMSAGDYFNVSYMLNLPTEEKMTIGFSNMAQATGTGSYTTSPKRNWYVGKFDNSDQITSVSNTNISAGDYLTDSNLTVLGSDITPADAVPAIDNVQDNSLFVEKVNARRYWFDAQTGTTPTYNDNFSTYADQASADAVWVSNDTADFRVNINNENFAFDSKVTSTTNTGAYYDLGSALSDTAWVVDFKLVITTNTLYSSGSVSAVTYITMNDATNGGAIGGTVDAMGFYISGGSSGSKFNVTWANSSYLNRGGGTFTGTITTGTFYIRLKRTGATSVKLEVYSDATRTSSSLIEEKEVTGTDSGITGLRYLRIQDNQSSAGTGTGQQIGTIDDVCIYDGVTTATAPYSPATWIMEPTFEENTFSSGWTSTDSTNVNTNTTTKVIDANVPSTGAQTGVLTYPLGYTLENNFVLEFKMEITSYTDNTDNTHQEIYIGMTNNTSAYNVSQQFIGMSISNAASGGGNDRYALQEFYNEALTANNGQGDSTNRPNANDTRYHRISKSGSTLTYSIYSDSSYSTLVETISGTATDTYSLNTISVKLRALDGTQTGVLTVEIDDIKIYNGVGTVN